MTKYRWEVPLQLAGAVEHGQPLLACQLLENAFELIVATRAGLPVRKLRCAQLIALCFRAAHSAGAPADAILDEQLRALEVLTRARSWSRVCSIVRKLIEQLARSAQRDRQTDVQLAIAQMRREMGAMLNRPQTLTQYADRFHVSMCYLSRSFRRAAGCSYRQELKRLRIEAAKKLLGETDLKVSAIARRVGVPQTSHFIRYYREAVGVTPQVYRQKHRKDLPSNTA